MFWPLIGGFIALVALTVLIGWLVDPDRRRQPPARVEPRPPSPRRSHR